MEQLKLFVWIEGWESAEVYILAHNEEEAWELLFLRDTTAYWVLQGEPKMDGEIPELEKGESKDYGNLLHHYLKRTKQFRSEWATKPRVVETPEAFIAYTLVT